MLITETERVSRIIEEGAKKSISLVDFIQIQIDEFKKSEEYKWIQIGERYANNESDILTKKRTYIDDKGNERIAPHVNNSKIQYPIVIKLGNQKQGYLLKKKMTVKEKCTDNKDDKKYSKNLETFFNNRRHKLLKNTIWQSIHKGICWWYVYFNDDMKLKAKLRYATEIIPIWADREHEELAAVIVRYFMTDYTDEKTKKMIEKVEYHDLDGIRFFVREDGKLIPDVLKIEENKDVLIKRDNEGNCVFANFKIGNELKTWKKIPFVYWKYNSQERPLIFFIKSFVDGIEKLKSTVNDKLLDTANGVHVVKGYQEAIEKFQHNLQTFRTIFLDEDGEYDYKQGTIDITAFEKAIEQLIKDVYDIGCGVNTETDKFGNQLSGVAIQQLYNNLDLDCSNIESEFQSSLEYFMFFFNTALSIVENTDYSEKEVDFIFNRSMITDSSAKISDVKNSVGLVSNKTLLANHPLVTNVADEIKQIENEEKAEKKKNDDYSGLDKTKSGDSDEE